MKTPRAWLSAAWIWLSLFAKLLWQGEPYYCLRRWQVGGSAFIAWVIASTCLRSRLERKETA